MCAEIQRTFPIFLVFLKTHFRGCAFQVCCKQALLSQFTGQRTAAVATERAIEANYVQVFIILMCYDKCCANKLS